jgi:hypothetical protein
MNNAAMDQLALKSIGLSAQITNGNTIVRTIVKTIAPLQASAVIVFHRMVMASSLLQHLSPLEPSIGRLHRPSPNR